MADRGLEALARVPLFSGVPPRGLKKILGLAEEARYMEGAPIVKEGEPGDSFFVIIEGEAKVLGPGGRVINRMYPGDFFGEVSLVDGGVRSATVVTETPMVTLMLKRRPFMKMLERDPSIAVKMLRELAGRLRRVQRTYGA